MLPDRFEVGEVLDLTGCTGLTELPEGMSVGWMLILRGCRNITRLPESLHVGSELDIGDTGIREIPPSLSHVKLVYTSTDG